jgi:hypothetical protein
VRRRNQIFPLNAMQTPEPVLLDSVTSVGPEHAGRWIVTGSHGGASAALYASKVRAQLYVFNDAGLGKDGAGIAALALLQAAGQPAVMVAHASVRIGDAADTWASGVISHVNDAAAQRGWRPAQPLRPAI